MWIHKNNISFESSGIFLSYRTMARPRSSFKSRLTPSVFDGLKKWQEMTKFKKAIIRLLARELSEAEIMDLRKKFEALDREGDGTITLDELQYSTHASLYMYILFLKKKVFIKRIIPLFKPIWKKSLILWIFHTVTESIIQNLFQLYSYDKNT